jgi:hypothetical protein
VKAPGRSTMRGVEGSHPVATWPLGTGFVRKELRIKSVADWARIVWVLIDLLARGP